MTHDELVNQYILEEQLKSDALYNKRKNDPESVVNGAYKGAVSSGILSRIISAAKPNGKIGLGETLAHVAGGTTLGATLGGYSNNLKVNKAEEARKVLAGKMASRKYLNEEKKIVNETLQKTAGRYDSIALSSGEVSEKEKNKDNSELKKTVTSGALMGGVAGGLGNMLFSKGKGGFLKGAIPMAAVGGANSAASYEVEKKEGDKMSPAATSALSFGAGAAIEPLVLRSAGKFYKSLGATPEGYFGKDKLKELNEGRKWVEDVDAKKKGKIKEKLKQYLLPNITSGMKHKYDSDDIDILKGMQGERVIDKSLLGHMAGKALWGGALGYGIVKLPQMYLEHKKKKRKEIAKQYVAQKGY